MYIYFIADTELYLFVQVINGNSSKPHNFVNYIIMILRGTANETTLKSLLKVKIIRLTQYNNNAPLQALA